MAADLPASADEFKATGNAAFAAGDYCLAIASYSTALSIDGGAGPTSHVLLSNRAAASLARNGVGDALSALADANACIRLSPLFAKAYGRKGNALLALRQPDEAYTAFQAGIKVEPTNASLREGMAAAQAAIAFSRGQVVTHPALPTHSALNAMATPSAAVPSVEVEDPLAAFLSDVKGTVTELDAARAKAASSHAPVSILTEAERAAASAAAAAEQALGKTGGGPPRSVLSDILSGQSTALIFDRLTQAAAEQAAEDGTPAHLSTGREYELHGEQAEAQSKALAVADLGDGDVQVERLTGRQSEWFNLNPFEVLQLPHTCNEDDIKGRYRRISTVVHPDKCSHAKAGDAFQEVKKAYDALLDPNRRRLAAGLMHNTIKEAKKQCKRRGTQGAGSSSSHAESEEQEVARDVRKAFADVEQRRRNYEVRVKAQAERETSAAAAEHESQVEAARSDAEWAKGRDGRKANWHDFEAVAKKRKLGEGGLQPSDAVRFAAGAGGPKPGAPLSGLSTDARGAPPAEDHRKRWR